MAEKGIKDWETIITQHTMKKKKMVLQLCPTPKVVAQVVHLHVNLFSFSKDVPGKALRDALKEGVLPLDRILLESDAPYMIPNAPEKELDEVGKSLLKRCLPGRNEPCTLPIVAHTVAKCLGVDAEEVARVSGENARHVFDMKSPVPPSQPSPPPVAKNTE